MGKLVVEKFPNEKNNGKLKAVFDALSKRDKFHQIFAIGATVTYEGKDGKDDPKSFTLRDKLHKLLTIDALAAAGEAKSKAKDAKSDAKTQESKAEVKKSKAETQTPKAG